MLLFTPANPHTPSSKSILGVAGAASSTGVSVVASSATGAVSSAVASVVVSAVVSVVALPPHATRLSAIAAVSNNAMIFLAFNFFSSFLLLNF